MKPRRKDRDMVDVERLLRKLLCTLTPDEAAWELIVLRAGLTVKQAKCLRMRAEGEEYAAIAQEFGMTTSAAFDFCRNGLRRVTKLLRTGKPVKKRTNGYKIVRAERKTKRDAALALYGAGLSQKQVCAALCMGLETLWRILDEAQVSRRSKTYRVPQTLDLQVAA